MAYMRSRDYYVTRDGEDADLHIWVKDGYDYWDQSMWATKRPEHPEMITLDDEIIYEREEGFENASGVKIPMSVMDEYVAMRLAELIANNKIGDTIDRAAQNWKRHLLVENLAKLKSALCSIKLDNE